MMSLFTGHRWVPLFLNPQIVHWLSILISRCFGQVARPLLCGQQLLLWRYSFSQNWHNSHNWLNNVSPPAQEPSQFTGVSNLASSRVFSLSRSCLAAGRCCRGQTAAGTAYEADPADPRSDRSARAARHVKVLRLERPANKIMIAA